MSPAPIYPITPNQNSSSMVTARSYNISMTSAKIVPVQRLPFKPTQISKYRPPFHKWNNLKPINPNNKPYQRYSNISDIATMLSNKERHFD